MNNNTILYLREVNKFLALVCILREDNFNKQGIIDYNFLCFREAIERVFEAKLKNKGLPDELSNGGERNQGDDDEDAGNDDHDEDDEALYNEGQTGTNYGSVMDDDDPDGDTIAVVQ